MCQYDFSLLLCPYIYLHLCSDAHFSCDDYFVNFFTKFLAMWCLRVTMWRNPTGGFVLCLCRHNHVLQTVISQNWQVLICAWNTWAFVMYFVIFCLFCVCLFLLPYVWRYDVAKVFFSFIFLLFQFCWIGTHRTLSLANLKLLS